MIEQEEALLALLRRYDTMLKDSLCPKSDYGEFCAWIEARRTLYKDALPYLAEKDEESDGSTKEASAH